MRRKNPDLLFLLPGLFFILLFYLYPVAVIAVRSLLAEDGGLTLARYVKAFTAPAYLEAWRNSLWFVTASTLIAAVGGTFVGYWTAKLPLRLKNLLLSFYSIPVTLSGLVVAFGFIVLMGRNGVFNQILLALGLPRLFNVYSWGGLLAVFPFYNIPLVALVMTPVFEQVGRELVEAARASGATGLAIWRYVLLPNILPGILAGSSVVWALMMGAFGTALAITGFAKNLLALQIYSLVSESSFDLPQADALAVVLMATSGLGLWILARWERRWRR